AHRQLRPQPRGYDAVSKTNPLRPAQGNGKHGSSAKSHDFTGMRFAVGTDDFARLAHRTQRAFRLHQESNGLIDTSSRTPGRDLLELPKIWCQKVRLQTHFGAGLCANKSNSPCSISLSCASICRSVEPWSVSIRH